jgi:16S rRNA processing protein RimM
VGRDPESAVEFTVADVKPGGGRVLLLLKTVGDRTAAEQFRGRLMFVEASDAAPPPEGAWYIHDLIGCEVRTGDGTVVGRIEDVLEMPGQHLWAVRNGDSLHHIPAVKEFIVSVDTGKKEVVVSLPDGLLG